MDQGQIAMVLLEVCGFLIVCIAGWAGKSLSDLTKSVEKLNEKMSEVLAKINNHDERIASLEKKRRR